MERVTPMQQCLNFLPLPHGQGVVASDLHQRPLVSEREVFLRRKCTSTRTPAVRERGVDGDETPRKICLLERFGPLVPDPPSVLPNVLSESPSLGPATPTAFDLGSNRQRDIGLNTLSYAATDMINIAAVAEWRNEQYETVAGNPESWTVGSSMAAVRASRPGRTGFFGYGPLAAGTWDRSNIALYGDVELNSVDETGRCFTPLALRGDTTISAVFNLHRHRGDRQ